MYPLLHQIIKSSDNAASHAPFPSQAARYISLALKVSGETNPNGSYILASLAKIPRLVFTVSPCGNLTCSVSESLDHPSPSNLHSPPSKLPSCSFAQVESSSCWLSDSKSRSLECHLWRLKQPISLKISLLLFL